GGSARAGAKPATAAFAELEAAEKGARAEKRGMWSGDFLANADKPSRVEPIKPQLKKHRRAPTPPGGGPALGAGFGPAVPAVPPLMPSPFAPGAIAPGFGWGSDFGLGFGPGSPTLGTPDTFPAAPFGPELSTEERNRRYNEWLKQERLRNERISQFAKDLGASLRGQQPGNTGVTPTPGQPATPVNPGNAAPPGFGNAHPGFQHTITGGAS